MDTQKTGILNSSRLKLIASTANHLRIELSAPDQLARLLGATVSDAWPSGEYDRDAMEYFLARLEAGGESAEGWYGWYAVSTGGDGRGPALVGAGGFFGPPEAAGEVEVGYSVLPQWQGRGYASEMVRLLVAHAFTFAGINKVVAHTADSNAQSIKVLERSGFHVAGAGEEAGTLRFECLRAA